MSEVAVSHAPRPLGKSGLTASPLAPHALAWGMWRFKGDDVAAARTLVETALDCGITLLDTADIYGPDNGEAFGAAEALLGRVLAEAPHLRERMTLATKAGIEIGSPYNSSAEYLTAACEASLQRMGVERFELFQIHRPDTLTHPADLAAALTRLREAGKIGEVGVSNHTPAQAAALAAHLPFPLASVQPEFSPLVIAPIVDGVLDQAMEHGWAVLAWSPLGGGRLGRLSEDTREQHVAEVLDAVAARQDATRAATAYAWIMAHPARPIPIIGSQRPERIREAATALDVRFTRAEWYAVLTAARGAPLP